MFKFWKIFTLFLAVGISLQTVSAQVVGEVEDISNPAFSGIGSTNSRSDSPCEDNCVSLGDVVTYDCGYSVGCEVGYEDGFNDGLECNYGSETPPGEIGGVSDDFRAGFYDGWYDTYIIGYNAGLADKKLICESQGNDAITYEFDDFTCECTCVEKNFLLDRDGDGRYNPDQFPIRQCSAPGPFWKEESTFLGPDCNDNDPLAWNYNVCGFCSEDFTGITTWYYDGDADGYYGEVVQSCNRPLHGVEALWRTNPGAGQDCDDEDREANISKTWYYFGDSDNYYGETTISCVRPTEGQFSKWKTTPGAGEDCDDTDGDIIGETNWYYDFDDDGYYGNIFFGCQPPDEGEPSKWSTKSD